ncbi:hypothetical protein ABW19_dt0203728 [Dactylella cylindrospora]|nr:hypothetical protein ABW19_dt0203728 [Dactylella cylindrospora]
MSTHPKLRTRSRYKPELIPVCDRVTLQYQVSYVEFMVSYKRESTSLVYSSLKGEDHLVIVSTEDPKSGCHPRTFPDGICPLSSSYQTNSVFFAYGAATSIAMGIVWESSVGARMYYRFLAQKDTR